MDRVSRIWRLLSRPGVGVAAFAGALYLVRLGDGVLVEDPARYAAAAKAIVDTGEWLTMHIGGEPYFNKPPLVFWLTACVFHVAGVGTAAARLVPALLGAGTLLLVYDLVRRWRGPQAGVLAAVVLGLTNDFLRHTAEARLDGPQAFFMVLAAWAGMRALLGGNRWWALVPGVVCGLGFLAKGPMVLTVLPAVALAALACGRARRVLGAPFWLGLGLGAAVAAPWFVLVSQANPEFAAHFFGHEIAARLEGAWQADKSRWHFVYVLAVHGLPWTPFWAAGAWMAARRARGAGPRDRGAQVLLLAWAAVTLAAAFAPPRMYGRYLVPAYPPLAALAVLPLVRLLPAAVPAHLARRLTVWGLVLGLGIAAAPVSRHETDRKYGIRLVAPLVRAAVPPGAPVPLFHPEVHAPRAVVAFYFDRPSVWLNAADEALHTRSPLVVTSEGGLAQLRPLGFEPVLARSRFVLASRGPFVEPDPSPRPVP